MGGIKALIGRVDRWQQTHSPVAVIWAINKKYGDDRGGYLSALIAYYGFISIFPLLLAAFSVVAFVLSPTSSVTTSLVDHLKSFPVLGTSATALKSGELSGSVLAVVIGVLGLVWGATGLAKTLQHTMDEAWNVPGKDRPNFISNLVVSVKWLAVFGLGIVVSTTLTSLSSVFDWGPAGPVLSSLPALAVNIGVYLVSFKIFTRKQATWRTLLPGAAVGGLAWTILTGLGIGLLTHDVKHASALYGTFGTTLGLIGFIYLIARVSMYGVELNVVLDRRLWPRTITSPPLSNADKQQLLDLARREERSKVETVRVEF